MLMQNSGEQTTCISGDVQEADGFNPELASRRNRNESCTRDQAPESYRRSQDSATSASSSDIHNVLKMCG